MNYVIANYDYLLFEFNCFGVYANLALEWGSARSQNMSGFQFRDYELNIIKLDLRMKTTLPIGFTIKLNKAQNRRNEHPGPREGRKNSIRVRLFTKTNVLNSVFEMVRFVR